MLVYLCNTHLFYATKYKLVHWRIQQADTAGRRTRLIPIYKQHGEMGNVGVVRERGRTADDRVIKAELHPPHRACLLYTSPSPRDRQKSRMPSSA